ncbi:MAG: DEAD/DEAH box helicase [Bacteroidetes bacterium HGW-Bacteroidetes-9]|jgi:ATP-dependent RNA helicase RhlE|nr:MAG: DEAD/DEAH box helicase [Bacteroidetes bacterium HGW-Bacteroidetes-9]
MTFEDLNIIAPITQALKQKGYEVPTPIQAKAIPHLLKGADVFGTAQTGTGKTAAFAIPILQKLYNSQADRKTTGIRALVLAPTRELAIQISESFSDYSKGLRLRHTVVYGGVSQNPQTTTLKKGVDILIATPGRLLDLMNQGFVKLNNIEFFILDEADRMLDMGFAPDIKRIIAKLPTYRQTGFFTATIPNEIRALADSLLQNPVMIHVAPLSAPAEFVNQSVYYVEKADKKAMLQQVFESEEIETALIFTRTKHGADKVTRELLKIGISAVAIHGNKSQLARQKALQGFKNRTIKVLVATDIASRGIDVDKLSHVINFELPEVPETYVHRIGRTGRAGESGTAISFCSSEERGSLKDINKLLPQNIEIKRMNGFLASSHVAIESAIADSPKRSSRQSRPSRPSRPSSSTSRTSSTSSTSSSGARPFQRKRW